MSVTPFNPKDSLLKPIHITGRQRFFTHRTTYFQLRSNIQLSVTAWFPDLITCRHLYRDSDPALFQLLLKGLGELEQAQDPALIALIFQILVLGHTGFRPQVDQCAACGKSCQAKTAMFSPKAGGRVCSGCEGNRKEDGIVLSTGSLAFIQQVRLFDNSAVSRLKATGHWVLPDPWLNP